MSIKSEIDRLNAIKERIRTNLVAQGVTVPADTVLADMAEQILSVAGEDGRGIVSFARTSGTGTAGSLDTYTITYTDNTTDTFTVYNGKNGSNYVLTDEDKQAIANLAAALVDVSGKLDKSGGTMTGKLVAQNNNDHTTKQVRNIVTINKGDAFPSGANGDICFVRKV